MKCVYRANFECRLPRRMDDSKQTCQLCLQGQLIDATELQTSAIMDKSFDKIEIEAITKERVYKKCQMCATDEQFELCTFVLCPLYTFNLFPGRHENKIKQAKEAIE